MTDERAAEHFARFLIWIKQNQGDTETTLRDRLLLFLSDLSEDPEDHLRKALTELQQLVNRAPYERWARSELGV